MDISTKRKKEVIEKEIQRLTSKIPDLEALIASRDIEELQPFLNRIRSKIEYIEDKIQAKDGVFEIAEIELKAELHLLAFLRGLTAWDQAEQALPLFKAKLRELRKDLDGINKQNP